jgi:hypothetical protein
VGKNKNAELLIIKSGGIYSYHWALNAKYTPSQPKTSAWLLSSKTQCGLLHIT